MFTKEFWLDALERAIKTAAQFVIGALALSTDTFVNAFDLDWTNALGVAVTGAVLSVLTSLISAPFGQRGTASLR